MSAIEVFEIEERFNPLEDKGLDEADLEQRSDYLPPVPDAELSRRVKVGVQSPQKRIERLLVGIPGQQFRILHAVRFCVEPRTCDEIVAEVDAAYPREVSVYDTAQLVGLLEEAGALVRQAAPSAIRDEVGEEVGEEVAPDAQARLKEQTPKGHAEGADARQEDEFLVVAPTAPSTYLATPAGLEAVEANCGRDVALALLTEESRYLPLYREILKRTAAEGGCSTKTLDTAIDTNPLTESPRRFCGYFLDRLEKVGAVRWLDSWVATELGRELLAADVLRD
ncbi:MAG: hypothetical protein LBL27_01160 [Coriobacteriales bacterium]|jgi:hypothetical protein|nr:hypothetical protein [Coriobacteriales bacterium]